MPASAHVPASRGDADAILDVVARLLEEGGDGFLLRDVAKQARVSLATVYRYFPSRDELVIAAVERWMAERVYATLPTVGQGEPLAEGLTRWFGEFLTPWKEQPNMLRVYMRTVMLPGGERLTRQGERAFAPSAAQLFDGYDPMFVEDVSMILDNVIQGLQSRFASGQIGMDEIAGSLERTIHRLADGVGPRQRS